MKVTTSQCDDGILTITLSEPARRNPLSAQAREEILQVIRPLPEDVRAIIFTGAEGVFSAGGDLASMPPENPTVAHERMKAVSDFMNYVAGLPVVTVAAVEKAVAGAAVGLACVCDVVVAGKSARFVFPFANLGLVPDGGLLALLPQRVGLARAKRVFLEAKPVQADQGFDMGLVDELVDDGDSLAVATETARRLAQRAPGSVKHIKTTLAGGVPSLQEALEAEASSQTELFFTEDFLEGKSAFFEKRAPKFVGR